MGQQDITRLFFENPAREFQIRGIARELKIPKTTVSYHIKDLLKRKMILKSRKGVFPSFRADESGQIYRFYKIQDSLSKILESGLIDVISRHANPKCIMLFGSFAKGEYGADSDIDIFVQAHDTKLSLEKIEKKLKHKINLLFEDNISRLSPELLNNIINGIKLAGYIKIR